MIPCKYCRRVAIRKVNDIGYCKRHVLNAFTEQVQINRTRERLELQSTKERSRRKHEKVVKYKLCRYRKPHRP